MVHFELCDPRAVHAQHDSGALPKPFRILLGGILARLDPATPTAGSPAIDWGALVIRYLKTDPEGTWAFFLYERFGIRP